MAHRETVEFPHILNKPDGETCRVENEDEYERALSHGWQLHAEPGWMDRPDPANPAAQLPPKPMSPVPPAKDASEKPVPAAKAQESHDVVLDGTVAAIADYVEKVDDLRKLQNLRLQETKGANRAGALKAIDDRIEELKA